MKRKLSIITAALLICSGSALAAPSVINTDGTVHVTGTTPDSPSTGQVTLKVLNKGITKEQFDSSPDIGKCFYVSEQTVLSGNPYSFSFVMDDSDEFGEYVIIVNNESVTYNHASNESLKLHYAVEKIKNAENYGTVRDVLKENLAIFGLSEGYNDSSLLKLAKKLYEKRKSITESNYKTIIQQAEKESESTGGGSSGGGGGGGGGGSKSSDRGVTFAPPAEVTPAKTEPAPAKISFTDVPETHWAYSSITSLAESGIISGRADKSFAPDDEIKREELAKILAEAFLSTTSAESDNSFSDVEKAAWYEGYVYAMYEKGIIKGIDNGLFGTGRAVTKQDAAVMIYRCLSLGGTTFNSDGAPADFDTVADYATEAVSALCGEKIINGDENGLFKPQKTLTRAEAAKIISESLKIRNKKI